MDGCKADGGLGSLGCGGGDGLLGEVEENGEREDYSKRAIVWPFDILLLTNIQKVKHCTQSGAPRKVSRRGITDWVPR